MQAEDNRSFGYPEERCRRSFTEMLIQHHGYFGKSKSSYYASLLRYKSLL